MTKALVLAVAAILLTGIGPGVAQQASWCLYETAGDGGGAINCGFHTFAQCQASRPGGSSHCVPNPALGGSRSSTDGSQSTGRRR
jgi:Protein of unknown function (DUF3551)